LFSKAGVGVWLAVAGCVLGGCGGGGGGAVDFYSSLPLHGASSARALAIVNGAKLALAQAGGKAGLFRVRYVSLDDSTARVGNWDPRQTAANARKAVEDPRTVYYVGEYNSSASEISIPILNRVGVPQVSPANTYVGLTTSEPGSAAGEPNKYYPTGRRTFLRIVPRDTLQAAALLDVLAGDGCTKVAIANDRDVYGRGLARLIELEAPGLGVTVVSDTGIERASPDLRSYAETLRARGVDCFVFAGVTANGAVKVVSEVHAAIPTARIYGGDGICERAFTDPAQGGIPASIAPLFKCTLPVLNLADYPGGKGFLAAYKAAYRDSHPDPYAILGYEAMKLGLDTVASLGPKGNNKARVLAALFATNRNSVIGAYSFDADGDTTLSDFGLYTVANGLPVFSRKVS
jgi:branched-chain amino acid transport system substrate-binding protein